MLNRGWRPLPVDEKQVGGYYAAPPGDAVDGAAWPWGWDQRRSTSASTCTSAVREAGLGDRYLDLLGPWRDALKLGLTTWPEGNGPDSRSDCHAWGASPNIELFRTVLGIESARLPPCAHPAGPIALKLRMQGSTLEAEVELPPGIHGAFEWRGARLALEPGRKAFRVPA